jgi:peptidyl-prolyl cis-trans isomerase D
VLRIVTAREAAVLARKDGEEKLAALAKGGDAGLKWGAPKTVSRQESKELPAEALRRIMAVDASKLPAHAGVSLGDKGYAIFRVTKVTAGEAGPADQNAANLARLDRQAGAEQLDAYLASLRARAKIEIMKANLEQK